MAEPVTGPGNPGDLTVVGTGIRALEQMTLETMGHVRGADKVLHLVPSGPAAAWLARENPTAESLRPFYDEGKDRLDTYLDMAEHVVSFVRQGLRVCLAAYGHPGIFAAPTHLSVRLARQEGYPARMLAGVSAEACLFADLGVDPAQDGCSSYEATDFLARHRWLDPASQLVLWQVGIIGMNDSDAAFDPGPGLAVLAERLAEAHPADHRVVLYEASVVEGRPPRTEWVALEDLPAMRTSRISTLYVPPSTQRDLDDAVLARLGVPATQQARHRQAHARRQTLLTPSDGRPPVAGRGGPAPAARA